MIDFDSFNNYMKVIMMQEDKDQELTEIIGIEGNGWVSYSEDIIGISVKMLGILTKDLSGWIEYWLYELNRGRTYEPGSVSIDKVEIPLETIEELYKVLYDNYEL
jgi:hypothetical protein